jgi:hypothetical protein
MKRRGNRRGAATPVVTGDREARQTQRVSEVDDVLPDRRLLRHPRRCRIPESGGAVATQIRHQHPVSGADQRRHHPVKRPDIVRKSVQQDDREPLSGAALFVSDREQRRVDRRSNRHRILAPGVARGSGLKEQTRPSETGEFQESSAVAHCSS